MTLEQALEQNPYDPSKGNESAYLRYLKYNVDGFYDIGIEEIRKLWKADAKRNETANL